MISYSQALDNISEVLSKIPKEVDHVKLHDSVGRVLSQNIVSDVNLPPFDNSAMDGFAVMYGQSKRRWKIKGEISAGNYKEQNINESEATAIMTGARIPIGADTVIPIEDVVIDDGYVELTDSVNPVKGQHIRKSGEDLRKNIIAVGKHTKLDTKHISIAASCGMHEVPVYKRLNAGYISSGDELIEITRVPVNDQIRASNPAMLHTSILKAGMNPVDFGFIRDDKAELSQRIELALNSEIDLLITTGAVSVGRFDFVQEVLIRLGAEIHFWKVNIKPGKPFLFSSFQRNGKLIPVFSLPGNPLSSFINFKFLVEKSIETYYYQTDRRGFKAILEQDLKKKDMRMHFVLSKVMFDDTSLNYKVKSEGSQSSGSMSTMGNADSVFIFPADQFELKSGEIVECHLL